MGSGAPSEAMPETAAETISVALCTYNGQMIDDSGAPLPGQLWDKFTFHSAIRERIQHGDMLPLVRYRFVTGATIMFRAHLREYICPAAGEWLHDGWIAACVACLAGV